MTRPSLMEAKAAVRAEAMDRRRAAHAAAAERLGAGGAGEALRRHFLAAVEFPDDAPVSGYWPVKSEIDPRALLRALHESGHPCGLPVIVEKGAPLVFRRWTPGARLERRSFGLFEPPPEAGEIVPRIVLVPLLAFDAGGRRLGYGGGFYDRTLARLRRESDGGILAVGLAYAAQEIDRVPADEDDERLDWIVTEEGARAVPVPRGP